MSAFLTANIMQQFRLLGIEYTKAMLKDRPIFSFPAIRATRLPFIYADLSINGNLEMYPAYCPYLLQELRRFFFDEEDNLFIHVLAIPTETYKPTSYGHVFRTGVEADGTPIVTHVSLGNLQILLELLCQLLDYPASKVANAFSRYVSDLSTFQMTVANGIVQPNLRYVHEFHAAKKLRTTQSIIDLSVEPVSKCLVASIYGLDVSSVLQDIALNREEVLGAARLLYPKISGLVVKYERGLQGISRDFIT